MVDANRFPNYDFVMFYFYGPPCPLGCVMAEVLQVCWCQYQAICHHIIWSGITCDCCVTGHWTDGHTAADGAAVLGTVRHECQLVGQVTQQFVLLWGHTDRPRYRCWLSACLKRNSNLKRKGVEKAELVWTISRAGVTIGNMSQVRIMFMLVPCSV